MIIIGKDKRVRGEIREIEGDVHTTKELVQLPRYDESGVDLHTLGWSVRIVNADGDTDIYVPTAVTYDDEKIEFRWDISGIATAVKGMTVFQIVGVSSSSDGTVAAQWSSEICAFKVGEIMEAEVSEEQETAISALDTLIVQVQQALPNIQQLTTNANTATQAANSAATAANTAATSAGTAATSANTAATAANTAAGTANTNATAAGTAATSANTAATAANNAARDANAIYNTVKTAYENGSLNGVSPNVQVYEITGGYRIVIRDAESVKTFNLSNGANGAAGSNGYSPSVAVTSISGGHRVAVTDSNGTRSFDVMDGAAGATGATGAAGADGADGDDGVSPTVAVTSISGGHRVAITDALGTTSFDVMDGQGGGIEELDLVAAFKNRTAVTNGLYKLTSAGIMCQNSVGEMGMVAYVNDIICLNQSPWGGFVLVNVSNNDSLYLDFDVTDHTDSDIIYAVMEGDTDESAILVTENKLFSETVPSDDHINALISTALNNLNGNGVSY